MQLIAREREFIMSDLIIGVDKCSGEQFKLKKVKDGLCDIVMRDSHVVGEVLPVHGHDERVLWIARDNLMKGRWIVGGSEKLAAKVYLSVYLKIEFEDDGVK